MHELLSRQQNNPMKTPTNAVQNSSTVLHGLGQVFAIRPSLQGAPSGLS